MAAGDVRLSPPWNPTPETRTRHRSAEAAGFKAHGLAGPDTGLITGCALTRACGPEADEAVLVNSGCSPPMTARRQRRAGRCVQWHGNDSRRRRRHHDDQGGPRPLIPGRFSPAGLVVDKTAGTLTYPAGQGAAHADQAHRPVRGRCARSTTSTRTPAPQPARRARRSSTCAPPVGVLLSAGRRRPLLRLLLHARRSRAR